MNDAHHARGKLAIVADLFEITRRMTEQIENADFLIFSVEKRQDYINEFDMLGNNPVEEELSPQDEVEIGKMIQEMIGMDVTLTKALEGHKTEAKAALATSNNQKKVLGYMNQAISSSGSYMDYKK